MERRLAVTNPIRSRTVVKEWKNNNKKKRKKKKKEKEKEKEKETAHGYLALLYITTYM